MATLDQASLKQQFKDGAKPTGQDFADLIDTIQSGAPTEGTAPTPVSSQVAIEGTDTTGLVSPAGLKAHIDARLSEKGEAEAGTDATKLMTPLRTKEAISSQTSPLITAAKNSLLGGVSSSYNTLFKLYFYLVYNFYTRTDINSRITAAQNNLIGGVSSSYNTLYKLYAYLVNNFYTRTDINSRITAAQNNLIGGVSSSYNTLYKLYAYLVNNFYTRTDINSRITAAQNNLIGGVSSSYNTLHKLWAYLVSNFYNKSTSDARYDKKTDTIAGTRIGTGINAGNITSGTLPSAVSLPADSVSVFQLTETNDPGGAAVGTDNLQDGAVKKGKIAANQVSADKLSFTVSPHEKTGYEPDTWWRLEIYVTDAGIRTIWMIKNNKHHTPYMTDPSQAVRKPFGRPSPIHQKPPT